MTSGEEGQGKSAKNARSLTRVHTIALTQQEYVDLLDWINTHGYEQEWHEKLGDWQHRTRLISYAYAQIEEMALMSHALPRSAAECERVMVERGSHCANPSEHPEP